MLLRGIAFAEARRNSARRILKPQNAGCEKDNAELTYDGVFQRNLGAKANTCFQSVGERSPTTTHPLVSFCYFKCYLQKGRRNDKNMHG